MNGRGVINRLNVLRKLFLFLCDSSWLILYQTHTLIAFIIGLG